MAEDSNDKGMFEAWPEIIFSLVVVIAISTLIRVLALKE